MSARLANSEIIHRYYRLYCALDTAEKKENFLSIKQALLIAWQAYQSSPGLVDGCLDYWIEVAIIVKKELGLGATAMIYVLLYPVLEKGYALEVAKKQLGVDLVPVISSIRKIKSLEIQQKQEDPSLIYKKINQASTEEIHAIMIAIAESLYKMCTLTHEKHVQQPTIANTAKYFYAPLAHRMNLHTIRTMLEDLYFKFIDTNAYYAIASKLQMSKWARDQATSKISILLSRELKKHKLTFSITQRTKSIASIWEKMKQRNLDFEHIYDVRALRIVIQADPTKEKNMCWQVYHIITQLYPPHPNRIRDWINFPKDNGYEALHVTVMDWDGKWVEVQIRTQRMHHIAEQGNAAHWLYKMHRREDAFGSTV